MLDLKRLLVISRPIFYLPVLTMYTTGVMYSQMAADRWQLLLAASFFTLPFGLVAYGINDIADRKSDALNPRKGGLHGAVLSQSETKVLAVITSVIVAVYVSLFAASRHYSMSILVLVICLLAYAYSMKPLRLKSRPGLDSVANGLGIVCVFLAGNWAVLQGWHLILPSMHIVIAIFLCSAAYHALFAAADYEVDRASGDMTICVALGKVKTLLLCAVALLITGWLIYQNNQLVSVCLACGAALCLLGCKYSSVRTIRRIVIALVFLLPLSVILEMAQRLLA